MTQTPLNSSASNSSSVSIDETLDRAGKVKPGWRPVLDQLNQFNTDQIVRRQNEMSRQLRTNGIAYNTVSQKRVEDRPLELDLIPMVIEPDDWVALNEGLIQRAVVKRLLLKDLYSEQRILRDGVIPPGVVFAHEGFLRVAQNPPGAGALPMFSVDVSRSPSGKWHAVDDICQVPDGIGYALENRLVLSRAMPMLFRQTPVRRLAGYFRSLQHHLAQSTTGDERCVILAYGSTHPFYFEYAYLAKYLGYTLVELSDLTVRDERVYLKTVAGLQRVDVVLRFIRDKDSDPLAVPNNQSIGIPGLLHAVHAGNVKIYNPLGVGILENPGFNAYLRALTKFYLDEDVKLLSAPTYWLGDKIQSASIQSRRNDVLYRDINTVGPLIDPATMSEAERLSLYSEIDALPDRFVAQERVDRSHAPCLFGKEQSQRQVTLRSYMIDNEGEYKVMDGGLCVLDSMANGGRPPRSLLEGSKDVWVLSAGSISEDTLLTTTSGPQHVINQQGELPSRVADNLFWLGRHAEKAENTIRVLHATLSEYLSNETRSIEASAVGSSETPMTIRVLLKTLSEITGAMPSFNGKTDERRIKRPWRDLQQILVDEKRNGSLARTLSNLRYVSNQLRDRLSPEMMRVLNDLDDNQKQLHALVVDVDHRMLATDGELLAAVSERFEAMLITLAAFSGLVHENLTHGETWRFLMLGKRTERARHSTATIRVFMQHDCENSRLLEILVKLFDSMMTYRTRYRSRLNQMLAMHLLLLDEINPKSVAYQFRRIDHDVRQLPGKRNSDYQDPLLRLATVGLSRVRLADVEMLINNGSDRQTMEKFLKVLQQIPTDITTALTANYFTHTEVQRSLVRTSLSEADSVSTGAHGNNGDSL